MLRLFLRESLTEYALSIRRPGLHLKGASMKERDIFIAALEKDISERATFLNSVCRDDPQLRARVDSLLAEHEKEGSFFLDLPAVDVAATMDKPSAQGIGAQIGPYKQMEQVGEGGMGVVYVAVQQRQ